MKNSKKGSIMPMVVIGLMMVSVIALIFLSAAVSGNTAYQTSADALNDRLVLDKIGYTFVQAEGDTVRARYQNTVSEIEKCMEVNTDISFVGSNQNELTKFNVLLSYDNELLIVKSEGGDVLLTVIVETEDETHERRVKVWTYGAYAAK